MSGDGSRNEKSWEWVGTILASYQSWEHAAIHTSISSFHAAKGSVFDVGDAVQSAIDGGVTSVETAAGNSADSISKGVRSAMKNYPEAVVGGTSVSFACAVGASNGTLLGRAPRRTAFVGLLAALCLRTPLVTKWGDEFAKVSAKMSDACKQQAVASKLLPPADAE